MTKILPNQNLKTIVDQLVIENCLVFGNKSKYTQKKVGRYLLGTRTTFDIFKLYELRYLLLKVYPFIQNLFYNPRLNSTLKTKKTFNQNYKQQLEKQRKLGTRLPSNEWKPRVRVRNSFIQKKKNVTPQILFATVTPLYTDIIKKSAQICNMPSHKNRWLNGSITAAISYKEDILRWNYITDEIQAKTLFYAKNKWGENKENEEKIKKKVKHYGESRWPSLIIIPDLSNNGMILKEATKVGIPVMGLVNSNSFFQIDYPIFAQDETITSVHFFCKFLATLIAKEMLYTQYKRSIVQTKKRKWKSKNLVLKSKIVFKNKSLKSSRKNVMQSKIRHKPFWRNTVFFRIVKPTTSDWKVSYNELPEEYYRLKLGGPFFGKNLDRKRIDRKKVKDVLKNFKRQRSIKTLNRFLKRNKNKVELLKKQKHLGFLLKLKKKHWNKDLKKRNRSIKSWKFIEQETLKKRFSFKKKNFLMIFEQKRFLKRMREFLKIQKIIDIQIKKKFLRFQTIKFFTEYKNYYALMLKQWKQTLRFQSAKYRFFLRKKLPYTVNLAKAQYYYLHPWELRREKREQYIIRSWSKSSNNNGKYKNMLLYSPQKNKGKNQHTKHTNSWIKEFNELRITKYEENTLNTNYKKKNYAKPERKNWNKWTESNKKKNVIKKNDNSSK